MRASIVHVWNYLTRCGHKFLWLKINPVPPGYTGSVYTHQFAIYSASGRILATLDVHRQQWVCSGFTPNCLPTDKNPVMLNRPGFPGEYFICELRLPDHYFRWKHNKLFLLLPEEYGPAFPAIVDCYTSPPTLVWPVPLLHGFSSSYPPLCKDH